LKEKMKAERKALEGKIFLEMYEKIILTYGFHNDFFPMYRMLFYFQFIFFFSG